MKDTKNSFKKLCKACVPSKASNELVNELQQQFNSKKQTFLNKKKEFNSDLADDLKQFSNSNTKLNGSKNNMRILTRSNTAINKHNFNLDHQTIPTNSSISITGNFLIFFSNSRHNCVTKTGSYNGLGKAIRITRNI